MFLLKEGYLSFQDSRLSFNYNINFQFSLVSTLKFPEDGE